MTKPRILLPILLCLIISVALIGWPTSFTFSELPDIQFYDTYVVVSPLYAIILLTVWLSFFSYLALFVDRQSRTSRMWRGAFLLTFSILSIFFCYMTFKVWTLSDIYPYAVSPALSYNLLAGTVYLLMLAVLPLTYS
ncbi:hypothetical protein AB9P05_19920 [Roseivirga sp. BDSF3-8]|uniref:hypothetical protein n=1 Tax=Roseivirga sp. BDSF3-8 TaxID=3241598 RepID=UPI003531CD43